MSIRTGTRLTFYQLFQVKDPVMVVEIPMIQRDYAQGREEATEVRTQFLDALIGKLRQTHSEQPLDLDFIYGNLRQHKFIPLDGQQRLTTLFLLHWILAVIEERGGHFLEWMQMDNASRFFYFTRTSAKDFCNALVVHIKDMQELYRNKTRSGDIYTLIQDQPWFFLSWKRDPTVKAMLLMLDAMHKRLRDSNGLYDRLLVGTTPYITFQFLDLAEFNLSDDLYIKMNARGIQLTPFENFKARFEQVLENDLDAEMEEYAWDYKGSSKAMKASEYVAHRMDTAWTDLFWVNRNKQTNLFDDQLMFFIRVVATLECGLQEQSDGFATNIQRLRSYHWKLTFYQLQDMGCITRHFASMFIGYLDLLSGSENGIPIYLDDALLYDEAGIFSKLIDTRNSKANILEYQEYLRFYAFYGFITHYDSTGIYRDQLQQWTRVVKNLVTYSRYDRAPEFGRSMQSIEQLLEHSHNILTYLSDSSNSVEGFFQQQVREERIKAILILKGGEWPALIEEAERHGYFEGQIEFLLDFSGILGYYLKHDDTCDWSAEENAAFLEQFSLYSQKAGAVFNERGLCFFDNHLWERALLTKGDYLLRQGVNSSLLDDRSRDVSWKRLLRGGSGEVDHDTKRLLVKAVLDDIEAESVSDDLFSIIQQAIIANPNTRDWRMMLVKYKDCISYCQKRFMRFDEQGTFLMSSQKFSTRYSELYTFCFLKELKNMPADYLLPFNKIDYDDYTGAEDFPYIWLQGFKFKRSLYRMEIFYLKKENNGKGGFWLDVVKEGGGALQQEIIELLDGLGFSLAENRLQCFASDEGGLTRNLEATLGKLRTLS